VNRVTRRGTAFALSSRASRRLAGRGTVRNEAGIANGISGVGTDVAAPDPRRASATAVAGAPESARLCRAAAARRQTLAEVGRALSRRAPCPDALNTQGVTAGVHLERFEPFEPGKPDSRQEPLGGRGLRRREFRQHVAARAAAGGQRRCVYRIRRRGVGGERGAYRLQRRSRTSRTSRCGTGRAAYRAAAQCHGLKRDH
jgi:hypothetical protein